MKCGRQRPKTRDRLDRVLARHEVLALQLLPEAGRERHPEVREPVQPWPYHPALLGHRLRLPAAEHVQHPRRRGGAEPVGVAVLAHPVLEPQLVDRGAEAGEHADAVGRGGDLVEAALEHGPGQPGAHLLAHLVGGLHVELQARHHAERAEGDDRSVEVLLSPFNPPDGTPGADDLDGAHGGGQRPRPVTGAVGPGRHRPRDRDVGEGGHGGEGMPLVLERDGEVAVASAAAHRDRDRPPLPVLHQPDAGR